MTTQMERLAEQQSNPEKPVEVRPRVSWPVPQADGLEIALANMDIFGVPRNIKREPDALNKIVWALLSEVTELSYTIESGSTTTTTTTTEQPATPTRDVQQIENWVKALQTSYADHDKRIKDLQYTVSKKDTEIKELKAEVEKLMFAMNTMGAMNKDKTD